MTGKLCACGKAEKIPKQGHCRACLRASGRVRAQRFRDAHYVKPGMRDPARPQRATIPPGAPPWVTYERLTAGR